MDLPYAPTFDIAIIWLDLLNSLDFLVDAFNVILRIMGLESTPSPDVHFAFRPKGCGW